MPRLFATALWLVATMVSTAIVWTATSRVAADVTDRPAPVVPRREVINQLESEAAQASSTTTSTRASTTSTTRSPTAPPNPPVTTPSPATTRPAPPPASPSTTVAARAPVTAPTTTQAPSRPTATYSTSGGVVRVACDGLFIQLLSATPADGWSTTVVAGGPVNVDVHFVRFAQDVSVRVICFGQPIRYFGDPPTRP